MVKKREFWGPILGVQIRQGPRLSVLIRYTRDTETMQSHILVLLSYIGCVNVNQGLLPLPSLTLPAAGTLR